MAKQPCKPLKITGHLVDGRINSADGILMLDAIAYHAWFYKYAPHVLEGYGDAEFSGYIGLPFRQLPGNRWAASKAIYQEAGHTVEHLNKRGDFFAADKIQFFAAEKGVINSSVGQYRNYRMPNVIRTTTDNLVTFWAVGDRDKLQALLDMIPAMGKKAASGYGVVDNWIVEECKEDYSLWHPEYGLMRPVEVGSEEATQLDLSEYPIIKYAVKPPYWKTKNLRLCYVPIRE